MPGYFQPKLVIHVAAFARKNLKCDMPSTELVISVTYIIVHNLGSQTLDLHRIWAATGEYISQTQFCFTHFNNAWDNVELVSLLAVSASHEMWCQT